MPRSPSPRRYAQAAFQIALERDELDVWVEKLRVISIALEHRDLLALLDAPQVPVASKTETIARTLGDSTDPLPRNLLSLLASRNQAYLLPGVLEELERLVDEHRGIERADVVSAVPLEPEERAKVAELLENLVGKEVRLTSVVTPEILGGLVVRVGDRVIDGSVKAKLQEMRKTIAGQMS